MSGSARVFLIAIALAGAPAWAGGSDEEHVWDGYLFRDRLGRVRVGWAVIAMGVMAQPAHVVGEPLAAKLGPLVSDLSTTHVFWNYELQAGKLDQLPRLKVRLRGHVREVGGGGPPTGSDLVLESPELVYVDWIGEAWLRAWAQVWAKDVPWYLADVGREGVDLAGIRTVLAALVEMRAVPGPGEAERAMVAAIDPNARLVLHHRLHTQWAIQAWLLDAARKRGLELPELVAMGPLPPSWEDLKRWFLDARDPDQFFAEVAKRWSGPLEQLTLHYYDEQGAHTFHRSADLAQVRGWTADQFARRRDLSGTLFGRR